MVGTALRIAWILYAARQPQTLIDPSFYSYFAERIADGHGYTLPGGEPTAYYPPGYPIALAAVVWLVRLLPGGYHLPTVAALFNLVLGVATIALVFELARRVFDDDRVGLGAAALVALWPNLIFHTAVALTETLFNFLLIAALLVVAAPRWEARPSTARLVVFGLLLGASVMVRPISVLVLPALWWVWARPAGWGWRWSLGATAVAGAAMLAVVLPWTIRNTIAMDAPVLISTNFGDNLCIGRHEGAQGGFSLTDECFRGFDDLERPEYETERNRVTTQRALERIRDHPLDEIRLVGLRALRTVENDHDAIRAAESYGADPFIPDTARRVLTRMADWWFYTVSVVALVGLFVVDRRADPRRSLLLWTMVAMAVPPLLFFGDPRFKVPVVPFLAVLAAVAVVRASSRAPRGTPLRR